jgi:hypothetical protein
MKRVKNNRNRKIELPKPQLGFYTIYKKLSQEEKERIEHMLIVGGIY